ncbi:HlyD family secretion protein [Desulfovibrio sp. JC022]|uniref:HlyD family secretion protein n=1 Tax=Desulfovibrio sp. JC022 TaxID=2593642 RepID=UPI0013D075DE|nr:HlyD family efflux transporter periplasmic adaptor subunit [Desulfovibrio sp. JC022]NDV23780.1 HlyD family efflux transporter periplasmic adaptor subunit [Desulfovibrio sp. JC022]
MKSFLCRKSVTWIVLLLIALLPLPSIISYMQRFVVRNGVVTAYRYEVHAPIDGVVEAMAIVPGMVSQGGAVLKIGNRRTSGQYETLERELLALEERLVVSRRKLDGYMDRLIRDIDQSLAILSARIKGEKAALKEAKHRRDRIAKLVKASVATSEDEDKAESEFLKAEAKVKSTQLEMGQLRHRRGMLAQGMLPNDLSDGALQVQKRINDLEQNILACKRRMSEIENASGTDAAQNTRNTRASVSLPETAVVWEVDVQDGTEVSKGDRLLSYIDRSRLMVEVAVDDATLELVSPGQPVKVRLYGRSEFIEGRVSRVMGSGGIWHSNLFAAGIKARSPRDGRVLVLIDDPQLYGRVEKFCGVGRTAYAEFEGIGLMEQYFGVFLR